MSPSFGVSQVDLLQKLEHDHHHLNRLVDSIRRSLKECLREEIAASELNEDLEEFIAVASEDIFKHFEAEETHIFPWIRDRFPELEAQLETLERAHDQICGVAGRIEHLVNDGEESIQTNFDKLVVLFARFDANYDTHAHEEKELLVTLAKRLSEEERAELSQLLEFT